MDNSENTVQPTDNLDTILSLPVENGEIRHIEDLESMLSATGQTMTVRDVILVKLTERAITGDMRAIDLIVKIMGDRFVRREPEEPAPTSDPRL